MTDVVPTLPLNDVSQSAEEQSTSTVSPVVAATPKKSLPLPVVMILSLVVVALVAGLGGWYVGMKGWLSRNAVAVPIVPAASASPVASSLPGEDPQGKQPGGVACTMDAMQCPDGRWIGRSGPNCEFVCEGGDADVSYVTAERMVLKYTVKSPGDQLSKSIVMPLPPGSQVQKSLVFPESTTFYPGVKINGVEYLVEVDRIPGYCDFYEENCDAVMEEWPTNSTVKRWVRNNATFALSIASVEVAGNVFGVSVSKVGEVAFSSTELAQWRALLAGIEAEVVTE